MSHRGGHRDANQWGLTPLIKQSFKPRPAMDGVFSGYV